MRSRAPWATNSAAAYAACDEDDGIRAVVVTGAGRAFCAGADMEPGGDTFAAPTSDEFTASPVHPPAWEVRKPVLAAINGDAIGIGLTMAMQCDVRIVPRTPSSASCTSAEA
jgi:enoyl-CoA hydratase/carnithine racemase